MFRPAFIENQILVHVQAVFGSQDGKGQGPLGADGHAMAAGNAEFLCTGRRLGSVFGHVNDVGRAFHGADPVLIAFFSIDMKQGHDVSFFFIKDTRPAKGIQYA